jgi:hypothetical protein
MACGSDEILQIFDFLRTIWEFLKRSIGVDKRGKEEKEEKPKRRRKDSKHNKKTSLDD